MQIKYRNLSLIVSSAFTLAFVMPEFIWNRTLVWDDWIWIHSSPDQLRDVAIQLGYWWLADVNVFIYSLKNPNLFLALLSFLSHIITIAVLSKALVRSGALSDIEVSFWTAATMVTPYLIIGYTNSVAFYNFYNACFITASYLFIYNKSNFSKIISAFLFFISFSLNSLMPAYFAVIIFSDKKFLMHFIEALKKLSIDSKSAAANLCKLLLVRVGLLWGYIVLPFIFLVFKMASPYSESVKNPYADYNAPKIDLLFSAPFEAIYQVVSLTFQVLYYGLFGHSAVSIFIAVLGFVLVYIAIAFCSKINAFSSRGDTKINLEAGRLKTAALLFAISVVLVFPYVLVGKKPLIGDFLEARHFIPSQPYIFALAILAMASFSDFLGRIKINSKFWAILFFTLFTSFCAWRALWVASNIWWENKINTFFIEKIKAFETNEKFWVFDNKLNSNLSKNKWNYEYTGNLIEALKTKENFGIARDEYLSWNQPVKLLNDKYFMRRYNLDEYTHQDSYNEIKIKSLKEIGGSTLIAMYFSELFNFKKFDVQKFVSMNIFIEYGCVDEMVDLISGGVSSIKSTEEKAFCGKVLEKNCKAINTGEQIIRLNSMEHAYALQRFPSLVSESGLHVYGAHTNFQHIQTICMFDAVK